METQNNMGAKKMSPVWILVLVVLGFVGYTLLKPAAKVTDTKMVDEKPSDMTRTTPSVLKEMEQDTPPVDSMANVKEFTLISGNFKYDLTEIKVKVGDTVKITLQNEEGFHDWNVDEFDAKTKILKIGESAVIEFVASKAGIFEYYCSVGQHRANGMVGKLIVE